MEKQKSVNEISENEISPSSHKPKNTSFFHYSRFYFRYLNLLFLIFALLFFIWVLLLAALKFYFLPQSDFYFSKLVNEFKNSSGVDIKAQKVEGVLSNLNPRIKISQLQFIAPDNSEPLSAKTVEAELSMWYLFFGKIQFERIVIINPSLSLERSKSGEINVSGFNINNEVNPPEVGKKYDYRDLISWLFRQSSIRIIDGEVNWNDKFIDGGKKILIKTNLGIEQIFGRTLVSAEIEPPQKYLEKISFKADFNHFDIYKPKEVVGRVNLNIDKVNFEELFYFLPQGQKYSGRSDLAIWAKISKNDDSIIYAKTSIENLNWQQFPLTISFVEGEIFGKIIKDKIILNTENLSVKTAEGYAPIPKQIDLTIDQNAKLSSLALAIPKININSANALVIKFIPWLLELKILKQISPQGVLENNLFFWNHSIPNNIDNNDKTPQFIFQGDLNKVGWSAYQDIPGVSGLSGKLIVTENSGEIKLISQNVKLDMPHIMYQSEHKLDKLQGKISWQNSGENYNLKFDDIEFANVDAKAYIQGGFNLINKVPTIDLFGSLFDGKGKEVWRYMPKAVDYEVVEWLKTAIVGGITPNTVLILRGDLRKFPFNQGSNNEVFNVYVPFQQATLKYQPDWPAVENAEGLLQIVGDSLKIDVNTGTLSGAQANKTEVKISHLSQPVLEVNGKAVGDLNNFKNFMLNSPLNNIIPFINLMEGGGDTSLLLQLKIPFSDLDNFTVYGKLNSQLPRFLLMPKVPEFTDVNNEIEFDNNGIVALSGYGKILDLPFELTKTNERGRSQFNFKNADITKILNYELLNFSWLKPLEGNVDVDGEVNIHGEGVDISWRANMLNVTSSLPQPFNKNINESWTLAGKSEIYDKKWRLGVLLNTPEPKLTFVTDWSGEDNRVRGKLRVNENGLININSEDLFANVDFSKKEIVGINHDVQVDSVDFDKWQKVFIAENSSPIEDQIIPQSGTIKTQELILMGQKFKNINVDFSTDINDKTPHIASKSNQLLLDINGDEIVGKVELAFSKTLDKISAKLTKLYLQSSADKNPATPENIILKPYSVIPAVDINVGDIKLGKLNIKSILAKGHSEISGYKIENLTIEDNNLKIIGSGFTNANTNRSQIEFRANSPKLADFVNQTLKQKTLVDTKLSANGIIEWQGGVFDVNSKNIQGEMNVTLIDGRVLEINPGAGRILSLLSFQNLFKRLFFDFSDTVNQGFTFEDITGNLTIDGEILKSNNIVINSSVARILMQGEVNIGTAKVNLEIYALPNVSGGLATGVAFLANPLAGVFAWVGQKILGNPFDQIFVQKITVKGDIANLEIKSEKITIPDENEVIGTQQLQEKSLFQQNYEIAKLLNLSDARLDPLYSERLQINVEDFNRRRPINFRAECR